MYNCVSFVYEMHHSAVERRDYSFGQNIIRTLPSAALRVHYNALDTFNGGVASRPEDLIPSTLLSSLGGVRNGFTTYFHEGDRLVFIDSR